ncbi:holo-[acyl-carrier-protein] synthase [Clostridiales bacterium COT073_COT-073]|nr:holo-[acyl-carrier-protein] synthase [Clostridiales bacterium COT073_COT-073]
MIKGIGIDLLETSRIKKALERPGFIEKYYSAKEIELASNGKWKKLANNYAAKEAVSKAFGLGFHKFYLRDIEILRDLLGKPYVRLHGNAKKIAGRMRIKNIYVSISDTSEHIMAVAIMER